MERKNKLVYPTEVVGVGIERKNKLVYPREVVGVGIERKNKLVYPMEVETAGMEEKESIYGREKYDNSGCKSYTRSKRIIGIPQKYSGTADHHRSAHLDHPL